MRIKIVKHMRYLLNNCLENMKKKLSVIMTLSKTFKRNFTGYSLAQIESILLLKASYLKNLKCELSRLLALKCMGKGFIDEV